MRKAPFAILIFFLFCLIFSNQHAEASSSQLIIINKKTNTLAFYDNFRLVRTFSVATGKTRSLTPEGTFRIVNKIVDRPYYTAGIPGGDPRNPLGDRWMGLEARGTYGTTYGIHGTNNENSIGKWISHGCVRMHNTEVRWLFSRVKVYTPVVITYSGSSFDSIAKAHGYGVTVPAGADVVIGPSGWVKENGKTYYYSNGKALKGWHTLSGKKYYFDNKGIMQTGWTTVSGKKYYLDSKGVMRTGWLSLGDKNYYLDSKGIMQAGWLSLEDKTYYLDANGVKQTGWLEMEGNRYFFNSNGEMQTGWLEDNGKKYYLDSKGIMKKGWLDLNGSRFYLDSIGVMMTGWIEENGKRYYLAANGQMQKGWVKDHGENYYMDTNGVMQTGWVIDHQRWYYLDAAGTMQTGWVNNDGRWYYLTPNGLNQPEFFTKKAGDKPDHPGTLQSGWVTLSSGQRYYFTPVDTIIPGWIKYENDWYYLNVDRDMVSSFYKDSQ